VSKVDGENIVGELLDPLNDKALATLCPTDYVLVFFILNGKGMTSRIS
jgi:hypothetical protein